jgi:hypothetical protein
MTKAKDESEEQRKSRLEVARKQAAKAREAQMIEKYRDKILLDEKKKKETEYENDSDTEVEEKKEQKKAQQRAERNYFDISINKPKVISEVEETDIIKEVEEKPKPKAKPKPKPKKEQVIIEQSSDDDDVFEDKPNVIFVKRVRGKGKNQVASQPPNFHQLQTQQQVQQNPQYEQQVRQQQPLPQQQQAPPPRPQLTPEKRLEMERYMNMSRGNFLPMSRPK